MFNAKRRFMTRGIQEELPLELTFFLWSKIDELLVQSDGKVDYLQVFELKAISNPDLVENQMVIHRSEEPEYKRSHALCVDKPITTKVYVIDSQEYCTMLLAAEY